MISHSIHFDGIQLTTEESTVGESQQTTQLEESLPASVSNHSSPAVTDGGFDLNPPLGQQLESFDTVTPEDLVATEKRPEAEKEHSGHAPTKIEGHCQRTTRRDLIDDFSAMDVLNTEGNMRLPNHSPVATFPVCKNDMYPQPSYGNNGLIYRSDNDHSIALDVDEHSATRHSSGCDDSGVFLEELPYSPEIVSGAPVSESGFMRGDRKSPEMRQYSIDSTQAALDSDAEKSDDLGLASSSIDSADDLDGDPSPSTFKINPHTLMKKPPPIPPRKYSSNIKCEFQSDKKNTEVLTYRAETVLELENNNHNECNYSDRNSENLKWKSEECLKSVTDSNNKWYQRGNEKSISVKDRIAMFSGMEVTSSPSKKDASLQNFPSEANVKSSPSLDSIDKECDDNAQVEEKLEGLQTLNRDSKWHSMYSLPLISTTPKDESKFEPKLDNLTSDKYSVITKSNNKAGLQNTPDVSTMPLKVDTENHRSSEKAIISNYPQTQLTNNKRYSYGPYSLSSIRTTEDLLAKKNSGLLSIIENRKQPLAKLKGLVIPEKPSQHTTSKHLPTIVSNDSLLTNQKVNPDIEKDFKRSMLSAASYKTMALPRAWNESKLRSESSFEHETQKMHELHWKNGVANENELPKYSPAFKTRTLDFPHAVTSSLSPTPPSSITSPLSPPPSSPSSVCSSNASSATSTATMQQNVFQFSLSHSKPVTPVLPEKPIMSPPSLPSDIEYEGDNSEDSSTSASPMNSKLSTKVSSSQIRKTPSSASSALTVQRYNRHVDDNTNNLSTFNNSGKNVNLKQDNYRINKENTRRNLNFDNHSQDCLNNTGEFIKTSWHSSNQRSLDYPTSFKTDYLSYEEEKKSSPSNNTKKYYPDSLPEMNCSVNGNKNGFIATSQETKSAKYHAQPLVFNSSSAKICPSPASEDFPHYLSSDGSRSYNNGNGKYIDEPKTYISECEFIPSKTWDQATELPSYRKHRLDSEDEDDSHSSLSHRTEDSRNTTDEYWSDATTDSFDKSLDPDLKPRRLSQQKVVLKAVADSTDSAQKFKALAEKWQHRSDTVSPPPPVPVAPAPRKEHKSAVNAILTTSSFLSSIINTSTNSSRLNNTCTSTSSVKLPPSLMPRHKDKKERSMEKNNFIYSHERLSSNDMSLISNKRDSYDPSWYDGSRRSSYSGSHFSDSGSSTDTGSNFSRKVIERENQTNSVNGNIGAKRTYEGRGSVDNLNNIGVFSNRDDNEVFLSEEDGQRNTTTMNRVNQYTRESKKEESPNKSVSAEIVTSNFQKCPSTNKSLSRFSNYIREDSQFEKHVAEVPKRSLPSDLTSSRALSKSQASLRDPLESVRIQGSSYFTKNTKSISVSDIRKAFESQCSQNHPVTSAKPPTLPPRPPTSECVNHKTNGILQRQGAIMPDHKRISSLDSTTSVDSDPSPSSRYASAGSIPSITRDPYGSVTSLASTTSLISPQELQQLIEEANQSLEETKGGRQLQQEIQVIVLHREVPAGSIGITLAGGADYEIKEITVHKVISGSLADRDGRVRKGDRVISINGRNLKGTTHREALDILKSPRPEVVLVIARGKTDMNGHNSSLDRERKEVNSVGRSTTGKEYRKIVPEHSPPTKGVLEKGHQNNQVSVHLLKDATGLGFSIEGGKDSPLGDRPLLIKRIFKGGVADKDGHLAEGDEIVSVNGQSVTAMTRTEVWNFLKKLPEELVVVKARKQLP